MIAALLTNGEGASGMPEAIRLITGNTASLLDTVESAARVVESNPAVRTVGYGGAPNALGVMQCDASVMCGDTLRCGSVGALEGYLHPVSVARAVMERTPHVKLVGAGAARFAAEIGAESGEMLSPEARADYQRWLKEALPPELSGQWPNLPLSDFIWGTARPAEAPIPLASRAKPGDPKTHGTTIWLAADGRGGMAGAVSTSGWDYAYPGRLGDSPAIGAGLYVDSRYGGAGCTHCGEMTIRAGTARSVVLYIKKGATVREACGEALNDLKALKGGHLGAVVLHALTPAGEHCVVSTGHDGGVPYWYWEEGLEAAVKGAPQVIS